MAALPSAAVDPRSECSAVTVPRQHSLLSVFIALAGNFLATSDEMTVLMASHCLFLSVAGLS